MATTVWKGHLTFGLISLPVRLHRAARAERVGFRQLYGPNAGRVKQVYIREEDPEEVPEEAEEEPAGTGYRGRVTEPAAFTTKPRTSPPEPTPIRGRAPVTPMPIPPAPPVVPRSELVKGYEYEKGRFVTVSKEDLEKITPATAREMQILEFVKLAEVDPVYFETSYYVTPEKAGERAYALLFEALRKSGYVALAQFAMHNREHIVILRPGRTGIVLHTMFYETEIRSDDEYRTDTTGVAEKELNLALLLIDNLAAPFEPAKYRDTYKEKLDAMIAAKIEGEETVETPVPKAKPAADILAALERSLAVMKKPAAAETAAPKRKKTK
jgi:DNA end-binding protein Ku